VRKALKDSALSSAFVRHAPAEMAVLEPIEDHPDRRATQAAICTGYCSARVVLREVSERCRLCHDQGLYNIATSEHVKVA